MTDDEFEWVRKHAHYTVVDAMDLALLTGQRPADVLKLTRKDIRDGALWVVQNKTGARLAIEITGQLAEVIKRITERPRVVISPYLIQDDNGQPSVSTPYGHASTRPATKQRCTFSFGTFGPRPQPTPAIWRTRRSCSLTRIVR